MKFQLYFTDTEIRNYLSQLGYQIVEHNWVATLSTYHNQTEDVDRVTTLAIPGDIPIDNFIKSQSGDLSYSPYAISKVFERELKARLLKL